MQKTLIYMRIGVGKAKDKYGNQIINLITINPLKVNYPVMEPYHIF
jgi:hypothetical protein